MILWIEHIDTYTSAIVLYIVYYYIIIKSLNIVKVPKVLYIDNILYMTIFCIIDDFMDLIIVS